MDDICRHHMCNMSPPNRRPEKFPGSPHQRFAVEGERRVRDSAMTTSNQPLKVSTRSGVLALTSGFLFQGL